MVLSLATKALPHHHQNGFLQVTNEWNLPGLLLPTSSAYSAQSQLLCLYTQLYFCKDQPIWPMLNDQGLISILGSLYFHDLQSDSKNGYTFATVYSSKCVSVFLNQTLVRFIPSTCKFFPTIVKCPKIAGSQAPIVLNTPLICMFLSLFCFICFLTVNSDEQK